MSDGSDIELQSALPKKNKKMPKQPKSPSLEHLEQEPKKISTKVMIHEALNELKSRKGTSMYAIKKFIAEKHKVDIDKINYIIKKLIKTGVEAGTIVQTKGVGATGSFKLAPEKKMEKKKPKPKKTTSMKKTEKKKKEVEKGDSKNKVNKEKPEKVEKAKKSDAKQPAKNTEPKETKAQKTKKTKEKTDTDKVKKMAMEKMTPAKKRSVMMKRKSIGSIIKKPKMKPRVKS